MPDSTDLSPIALPDLPPARRESPAGPEGPGTAPLPAPDLAQPTDLLPAAPAAVDLSGLAAGYATRARGAGTRRVYRSAWQGFAAWCATLGQDPLPADPEVIAWYVTKRAHEGCAVATIRVDLAAIRTAHLLAGHPLDLRQPRLTMVLEGVTRSRGTRARRQAAPAVPDVLRLRRGGCRRRGPGWRNRRRGRKEWREALATARGRAPVLPMPRSRCRRRSGDRPARGGGPCAEPPRRPAILAVLGADRGVRSGSGRANRSWRESSVGKMPSAKPD